MRRIGAIALASLALVLAACGSDDGPAAKAPAANATTAAPATTAAATTAAPTMTKAPATTAAPTSTAPTSSTTAAAPAGIVPGADAEVDAVVQAYSAVFDSAVPFDQKAPYLADAAALQPAAEAYAAAGQRFGGIKLVPTAVVISGDTAAVTYDVMFATTPQYQGLAGAALKQGGTWTVTRDEFCSFMASARTPCPA